MLTPAQINFLNKITNTDRWMYTDGIVDVHDNVTMNSMKLTEIPVQFGTILGHFNCDENQLTSLEGGPVHVRGYYSCDSNLLTTLIGAPKTCNGNFYCEQNQLTSLEGCPYVINNDLYCYNNPNLHILYGIRHVLGNIKYNINDLNEWIISKSSDCKYVTYKDIADWIAKNNRFEFLLHSCTEIRQYFSSDILRMVELKILC